MYDNSHIWNQQLDNRPASKLYFGKLKLEPLCLCRIQLQKFIVFISKFKQKGTYCLELSGV